MSEALPTTSRGCCAKRSRPSSRPRIWRCAWRARCRASPRWPPRSSRSGSSRRCAIRVTGLGRRRRSWSAAARGSRWCCCARVGAAHGSSGGLSGARASAERTRARSRPGDAQAARRPLIHRAVRLVSMVRDDPTQALRRVRLDRSEASRRRGFDAARGRERRRARSRSCTSATRTSRSRWPFACAASVRSPKRSSRRRSSPPGAAAHAMTARAAACARGCSGSSTTARSTRCAGARSTTAAGSATRASRSVWRRPSAPRRRSVAATRPARSVRLWTSSPAEQSHVIELAYYGGFSHSEIAAMLETPIGTIKGRMRLGLQKLRLQLGPMQVLS